MLNSIRTTVKRFTESEGPLSYELSCGIWRAMRRQEQSWSYVMLRWIQLDKWTGQEG